MASNILYFPQQRIATSAATVVRSTVSKRPNLYGLRLIRQNEGLMAAMSDSQAQAIRIVAQVELEIARRAARQRQAYLMPSAPFLTDPETPGSMARRLLAALFSFARPA